MAGSHSFTAETAFLPALRAGVLYVLFAGLWIALSDRIILFSFSRFDTETLTSIQTVKDWFFVLATGGLFTLFIYRLSSLEHSRSQIADREKSYRMLFESNPHPMFICDKNTVQIIEVNEAAIQKYGYTHEEFLKKTMGDFSADEQKFFPEHHTAHSDAFDPVIVLQKKKNGALLHVEITISDTVFDGKDRWVMRAHDVTKRVRTEIALRSSEKRYRTIVETAQEGIWVTDHEANTSFANQRMSTMLGCTPEEMLGRSVLDFVDEKAEQEALTGLERRKQGIQEHHDVRFRRKDGSDMWAIVAINPLVDEHGEGIGSLAMMTDITARKQAEESLKVRVCQQEAIADLSMRALTAPDLDGLLDETVALTVKILDMDFGKIEELLPDGKHLLLRAGIGWKKDSAKNTVIRLERYAQTNYIILANEPASIEEVAPETQLAPSSLLTEHKIISGISVLIQGASPYFGVLSLHSRQNRVFTPDDIHFLQTITNILAGTIARMSARQVLMTLNEQLESRVAERTARLETISRELEAFTYSVSHDLHAPLRSINGFSSALLEDCGDQLEEQYTDYLRRICAASTRMGHLMNDLIKLSRISRAEIVRTEVNITAQAESIIEEMRNHAPDRSVVCLIRDNLTVHADPNLLRIVLQNLMENAWKFTGPVSDPRIEIGAIEQKDPTVFFIRDNGVGFDMTYSGKIFGTFQRLHSAQEFEGTGIGLATVQRIIHRHGGKVWAEGIITKGATFYFTLS